MIIDNGVGTGRLFEEIDDAIRALAGSRTVVVNAHDRPNAIPKGAVVMNFENVPLQVKPDMFPGCELWDFSERNCEAWRAAGRTVTHVPVGYHPSMERFTMKPWAERDIDVVLTGVINDRRAAILQELHDRGFNVVAIPHGTYGAERDEILSRSKLALGVLYYPEGIYGTLRAAHCAANRLPLLSETAPDMPSWSTQGGVAYDEIVEVAAFLLARDHAPALQGQADVAYEAFKACPMVLPEPKVETKPDPWLPLRGPTPLTAEQIGEMYDKARGAPASTTPRVHFAVPFYRESWRTGRIVMSAVERVVEDLAANGVPSERICIEGDSLICRMRQRVCHGFLLSGATHLLFCDGDIEPLDPGCARKMLQSGLDVVAGAAPFKATGGRVVCNVWPGSLEDGSKLALWHGCLEVMDAGTGFMMISRQALLKMMAAHPELLHWSTCPEDNGAPLFALFDTGIVDGVYQSEDFLFCRRWQALGGKVHVHVPSKFRHWGDFGYEGSFCAQYGLVEGGG